VTSGPYPANLPWPAGEPDSAPVPARAAGGEPDPACAAGEKPEPEPARAAGQEAEPDQAYEFEPVRVPRGGVVFNAREKALVELLAAGHTDASAARRLGVSPRTVSYTLQSLMDRLEVENRFQLGLALGTLGARDRTEAGPPPADTPDLPTQS